MMEGKANNKYSNLPAGWEMKRLKDVAINCGDYGANAPALPYKAGDIRYIRITDIDDYGHLISDDKASLDETIAQNYLLKDNDILFARTGDTVGKSLLYKSSMGRSAYAGYLIRFTLDEKQILPDYFDAIAKSDIFEAFKISMKRIGAKPNINSREYGIFRFPVPLNLGEQKEIAKLFSKVDEAIASVQNRITAAERLKKSLMQKLLTGKMKPDGTFRTPEEFYIDKKFGKVPIGWEVKRVDALFDFYPTASYSRSMLSVNGDCKYIHYGDIHTRFDAFLDISKEILPCINKDMVKKFVYLEDGDIIISDTSEDYEGVGKLVEIVNIGDSKVISGLHTLLIRPKTDELMNGFKGYLFNEERVRLEFLKNVTGIKVYSISKNSLANVLLPIPPRDEQIQIKNKLDSFNKELCNSKDKIKSLERLKKSLMQNLLTGKIRVEHLVNN